MRELTELWERVLESGPIGSGDDFFERGGDSLRAALVVAETERILGRILPPDALFRAPTAERLLELAKLCPAAEYPAPALLGLRVGGSRPPIFCIDWPGGRGRQLRGLADALGSDQPFYCVIDGGLPWPWSAGTTIETLAEAVITELRMVQPEGPVHLAGNCFGAIIAREAARILQVRGEPVGLLAMLAISPRDFPTLVPRRARTRYARAVAIRERWTGDRPPKGEWIARVLRSIPGRAARLSALAGRIAGRPRSAWPPGTDIFGARDLVARRHRPGPFQGKASVFLPFEVTRTYTDDPMRCWEGLARQVSIHQLPGEEDSLYSGPAAESIAALLQAELAARPAGNVGAPDRLREPAAGGAPGEPAGPAANPGLPGAFPPPAS